MVSGNSEATRLFFKQSIYSLIIAFIVYFSRYWLKLNLNENTRTNDFHFTSNFAKGIFIPARINVYRLKQY